MGLPLASSSATAAHEAALPDRTGLPLASLGNEPSTCRGDGCSAVVVTCRSPGITSAPPPSRTFPAGQVATAVAHPVGLPAGRLLPAPLGPRTVPATTGFALAPPAPPPATAPAG